MTNQKRPYAQPNAQRRSIYTDDETWAKLKSLGNGNASAGIREAVRQAQAADMSARCNKTITHPKTTTVLIWIRMEGLRTKRYWQPHPNLWRNGGATTGGGEMSKLEIFEKWAEQHGFDVSRHKTGFYLCRSTQLAFEAYMLGVGNE